MRNKYGSYKEEGLRIVDKRGLPYETTEDRYEAWYLGQLEDSLWDRAVWLLETEFALPTRQEIQEQVAFDIVRYLTNTELEHFKKQRELELANAYLPYI